MTIHRVTAKHRSINIGQFGVKIWQPCKNATTTQLSIGNKVIGATPTFGLRKTDYIKTREFKESTLNIRPSTV